MGYENDKPGKNQNKNNNTQNQKEGMKYGAGPEQPYSREPSNLPPGESPSKDSAADTTVRKEGDIGQDVNILDNVSWLIAKSHEIFTASVDYKTANITDTWETTLSHFNSEHENKTGNNAEVRRKQRGVFRPKTRATIKGLEASFAEAAFSTLDYVQISAENELDQSQVLSAQVNKNVLQHRLSKKMRWFQTALGAWQDTKVYGVCITHNYWRYEADTDYELARDEEGHIRFDEAGNALAKKVPLIRKDDLACDNVPPENIHFDPMCDWRDPAGTSPYIVYVMPMYVGDALERMEQVDPKTGQPQWMKYATGTLLGTVRQTYDRTRQAREGDRRIDPADDNRGTEYAVVWAHMNIIRINGDDYMYWTMGTEVLLSKPVLLREAYPHLNYGERPFTIGNTTIETHRNYPSGEAEQMLGLQREINIIANQRVDNVRLALNKRYYVRRGSQVDLQALIRNVPGGSVQMSDPEKDVLTINTPDVTSSSYQEQDRLSIESDELVGAMSPQSMQGQRGNIDSVGGLGMLDSKSSSVRDYGIKVFMETWMEPTLRQFVRMIQMYETDETILGLAVQGSDLWQKFGIDTVTDELLIQDLTVKIDVGMGMTNPITRIERMMYAIEKTAQLPGMAERLNSDAIANEVFGALGYRDASKFYKTLDQFMEETAGQDQTPPEIQIKMEELRIRQEDNQMRHEREVEKLQIERETKIAELALKEGISLEEMENKLQVDLEKIKASRDIAALTNANKRTEQAYKAIENERNNARADRQPNSPTE